MSELLISVIIPSFNSERTLQVCLDALVRQAGAPNFEILVVDCSAHDRPDVVCKAYQQVRLIKHPIRFNPGEGRNIGASHARGAVLVFVDADVILDSLALVHIYQNFKSGHRVFGGALEISEHSPQTLASVSEHFFYNHESQSGRHLSIRNNLSSALLVVDKDVFKRFGGFSDIPRMQDTELTERMRTGGEVLYFIPDIVGYQIQNSPMKKVLKKVFINGNNLYFIRYHGKTNFFKQLFFCVALPLIALLKATRINCRNIRYNADKTKTFLSLPIIYFMSFIWMAGFYKAILSSQGISRDR